MDTTEHRVESISATVKQYVQLIGAGSADDLIKLFAEHATVEDPVGTAVRVGRKAIHEFFTTLESLERTSELLTLRVSKHEAAFQFAITFTAGDTSMRLSPIDTVVIDQYGRITSLRSYFSPSDIRPVSPIN